MLKLWLLEQFENTGYDIYDSAVVAANTEEEARIIRPGYSKWGDPYGSWCSSPDKVTVTYLGIATGSVEPGIVLSSFNAG